MMCLIPLPTKKELKSSLTKHDPLLDMIVSGYMNLANTVRSCLITTSEVDEFTLSGHLS